MSVSTNVSLAMTAGSGEGGKGRRGWQGQKRGERAEEAGEEAGSGRAETGTRGAGRAR